MEMHKFAIYDLNGVREKVESIHDAAEQGDSKGIGFYMRKRDAQVDEVDRFGRTALMWAAERGHIDIMEMLFRYGAEVDFQDQYLGRTALHWASRAVQLEAIQCLILNGANVNIHDKWELNPLWLAQQKGDTGLEVVEYLIGAGAKFGLDTVTAGIEPELSLDELIKRAINHTDKCELSLADDSEKENLP